MQTVKAIAKKLNINEQRVLVLIHEGRIKARKVGRDWVITDYAKALYRKNGRPAKIPKLGLLILACAPILAYLYSKLFEFQGF